MMSSIRETPWATAWSRSMAAKRAASKCTAQLNTARSFTGLSTGSMKVPSWAMRVHRL
jgi:hypothetical protein